MSVAAVERNRWVAILRARVAAVLRVAVAEVPDERPLTGLGLDSLAAVELQQVLDTEFGVGVELDELLDGMTFAELLGKTKTKTETKTAKDLGEEDLRGAEGRPRTSDLVTGGQRALWFLERVAPGNGAYHIVAAARVRGDLDGEALRRAFEALVVRHEALRTVYPEVDGEPRARVMDGGLDFAAVDGSGWSDGEALAWLGAEGYRAFDLERGPLVRVRLLRRGGERALLFAVHHIAADFWSLAVMLRDLGELYRAERAGTSASLPLAPAFQMQASRETAWLAGPEADEAWRYWSEALAGELPVLDLPADRPRPPAQTFRGGAVALRLSRGQVDAFRDAGRRAETTLFTQIVCLFAALLARTTGQRDLILGTPTSGRAAADLASTVGYFVNPVPLRLDLTGDPTFAVLRERARRAALGAFAHAALPFPLLAERLQPARDPSRTPIFQAMLTLLSGERLGQPGLSGFAVPHPAGHPAEPVHLADLTLEPLSLPERRAQLDLALTVAELSAGAVASFDYNADLFDRTTIARLASWWERLAASALADPNLPISALPLLAPAERHQLIREWNDTAPLPAPPALLHELVLAQAARTPEAVAVVSGAEALTYRDLAAHAERLAASLRALGVGPEATVALCVQRDAGMVVTLLAILMAGGAYLPLDPALPDGRIAAILAESRAPWLLAGENLIPRLEPLVEGLPATLVSEREFLPPGRGAVGTGGRPGGGRLALSPESLAYVLYTSGSSGAPKGVAIAHRSAVALIRWAREVFPPEDLAGVLAATSLGFDLSVFEIFVPLAWGGRVVVVENALALPRLPPEAGVTLVNTVPSVLAELLAGAGLPASVRTVNLAGEPLPGPLAAAARQGAPGRRVLNLYGPSEDTTYSTFAEVAPGDPLPALGRPLASPRPNELDAPAHHPPHRPPGELFLAGAGLARGYLHRPDLTAERFLPEPFWPDSFWPDPFSPAGGGRLYATGDLVRLRPNGELEYLGRRDQQVKVRGVRIELGEVEAALAAHPTVRGAAVLAASAPGETGKRLVAYVAADADSPEGPPSPALLRAFLRARLPEAMVPAGFVLLPELPRTASGKVDRHALARLGWTPEAGGGEDEPRGEAALLLAEIWAEMLGVPAERLGPRDDFFALGGHSLAAARLLARVRERLGVEVPLAALLADPTLGGLAARVEAALAGGTEGPLPSIAPRPAGTPAPLTPAQRRLGFLAQLAPESAAYHLPAGIRLRGALAAGTLAAAIGEIVRRHEALRTAIDAGPEPVARTLPPPIRGEGRGTNGRGDAVDREATPQDVERASLPPGRGEVGTGGRLGGGRFEILPLASLDALPGALRERELARLAREEALRPFDLARGPLARFRLLRLGDGDHVLLSTFHHLVADGASLAIFQRELSALYGAFAAGRPSPLAPPAVQHGDYALWQARHEAPAADADLAYFRERLAGAPQELPLPFEPLPPSAPRRAPRAAFVSRDLSTQAAAALARLAREAGATRFMVLASAAAVLLGRLCGVDDLVLGTPVAHRRRPELADAIGLFVNTLPLRADLSGDPTVAELAARQRREVLAALAHQDLPFERLVEALAEERDPFRTPLVQAVLTLEPPPLAAALPGVAIELLPRQPTEPKFDLVLQVVDHGDSLHATAEYPASHSLRRFERTTVARLLSGLDALLAGMAEPGVRLSALSPLSAAERQQTLREWNDTDPRLQRDDLGASFLRAARRSPAALALAFEGAQVSYGELARRALALARRLVGLGVGPESIVGLASERSIERIVGLLGIVLSGGAYLPLDPAYPDERLALLVADAGARIVVTHDGLWRETAPGAPGVAVIDLAREGAILDAGDPIDCEPPRALAANLACVLYTSGSTGRPKGVAVTRRGVLRLIEGADYVDLAPADRVAQVSTLSFDTASFEIWGALLSGACLVMPPPGALSVEALGRFVREGRVTVLWLTSGLFQQMVESALPDLRGVRQLLAGGDALSVPHVLALLRALPGCRLVDGYGPTENTTFSTCHAMQGEADLAATVPIGRPISGSAAYVLGSDLGPVPIGGAGELWLGGEGLARGYHGDPARTAERFLPDPASGEPGARLYRSGDRVRQRGDGVLEFLGRLDRQVKVRGFRVELGEVEAALAAHPEVRGAAVEARPDAAGGRRLVAWTAGAARAADTAALRRFLLARLPEHAVPSLWVAIPELPLTPQGKVDRRALPEPAPERVADGADAAGETAAPWGAAHDPLAELLAGLFAEVLGVERVGPDDDFFALGGHSLLATRAVSRVKAALDVEISLAELFAAPTPIALAARLAGAGGGTALPPIEPLPRASSSAEAPLSFAQERLWFLDQLAPGSPLYNLAGAVRLSGDLSLPALAASFGEVVRRHEALRTRFLARDGAPVARIDPPAPVPLPLVDLSGLAGDGVREGEARALLAAAALVPFDLARGPLLRPLAIRSEAREHHLLLALHHIAGDGWSIDLLLAEVRALYRAFCDGRPSPLPPLAVQYRDVAAWQRGWLRGEALAREIAAWREALAGAPQVLELPADRPRPALPSHCGGEVFSDLPAPVAAALDRLARRHGATRFMALAAGFAALLARYSGQEEVVVGTPVANRGQLAAERLIGFFVNTLALRVDLAGDPDGDLTVGQVLSRVRRAALAAYAHQELPFEKLVDELQPERDLARHPLFQVLLSLEEPRDSAPLAGLAMAPVELEERTAKLDLTLAARPLPGGGLRLALGYARDLFDRTTVQRLGRHLAALLAGLAQGFEGPVATLPLLDEAEAHQLRREWNDTAAAWDLASPVHELVGRWAGERPDAIALETGDTAITYGELAARAARLARRLVELGVGRGTMVAVLLERSPEIILSVLAIWRAGGVYLPLAAAQPPARLAFLLADAEPAVVVARGGADLPAHGARVIDVDGFAWDDGEAAAPPLAGGGGPTDLAYMLYTSGSTGEPKGVLVEHRSLVNLLRSLDADIGVGPRDVMSSWTTPTFDPSLLEWFLPLAHGARLHLLAEEEVLDFPRLAARIREAAVTLIDGVPGLYQPFVEFLLERGLAAGWERVRSITAGGESVSAHLLSGFLRLFPRAAVRNSYGPTETAIIAANYLASRQGEPRGDVVGRPVGNLVLRLVDRQGRPVPIGVAGELWIGGAGVARGYFRRPELTAERFVEADGVRWFRSGDLGRYLADGNLEFLGRVDQQVKIRGVRVEPGEVEAALQRHPAVREVAVVARQDGGGERRLVAYVVPRGAPDDLAGPAAAELRAAAAERLPEAMVPSAYVLLAALPRDRNGKLDRRALPAPGAARPDLAAGYATPRTELERRIAGVWGEVLGLERVGIEDSFFELGGNSLAAVRLRSRLERALGREVSIVDLFRHPTVAAFAAQWERQGGAGAGTARAARTAAVRQESLGRLRATRERKAG